MIDILVHQAGRGTFDVDDIHVTIGLRVVGKAKIAGAVPALRRWIQSPSPSYVHIIDACDALASVPEKEAAANVLTEGLSEGRIVPAAYCAQSLVAMVGVRAVPTIRKALLLQTDSDEAKKLRNLLQKAAVTSRDCVPGSRFTLEFAVGHYFFSASRSA